MFCLPKGHLKILSTHQLYIKVECVWMFVLTQYFMQHISMVIFVRFDTFGRLFQKADKAWKSIDCSSVFNFLQVMWVQNQASQNVVRFPSWQVTHVSWSIMSFILWHKNLPHINFSDSWTSSASKGMFTVQVIWAPKALLGLGLIKEERTFTHFLHKIVNVLNN
jgi:hypothetical protein